MLQKSIIQLFIYFFFFGLMNKNLRNKIPLFWIYAYNYKKLKPQHKATVTSTMHCNKMFGANGSPARPQLRESFEARGDAWSHSIPDAIVPMQCWSWHVPLLRAARYPRPKCQMEPSAVELMASKMDKSLLILIGVRRGDSAQPRQFWPFDRVANYYRQLLQCDGERAFQAMRIRRFRWGCIGCKSK